MSVFPANVSLQPLSTATRKPFHLNCISGKTEVSERRCVDFCFFQPPCWKIAPFFLLFQNIFTCSYKNLSVKLNLSTSLEIEFTDDFLVFCRFGVKKAGKLLFYILWNTCILFFTYLFINACFVFWFFFFQNRNKDFLTKLFSCLLACSRPSAVWHSISRTVPRRAAATAGWETLSRAARLAPPNLFPSASPRRSTMSKHHPTAAPREMETQTLNRVSTAFSLDFRRWANLLICAFQFGFFFCFFFVI